ncbi:hypothetical protein LINPERHAP1_LOCUS29775, partial [Linum perenne]
KIDELRFRIPLRSPEQRQSTDQRISILIQSVSIHHHNSLPLGLRPANVRSIRSNYQD